MAREEMRKLVRTLLMAGADFIKICTTGGITSLTDSWDEPQLATDEIRTAVAEARAKGKGVAVHAEGLDGIRNALTAEIHSLEHGWFVDEQCVDHMIEQRHLVGADDCAGAVVGRAAQGRSGLEQPAARQGR